MKSKLFVISLCILVSLIWGLYPLLAQQIVTQGLGGPVLATPTGGFNPSIQTSPQAPSPHGTTGVQDTSKTPGLQVGQPNLSQASQRACGGFPLAQQVPMQPMIPGGPNLSRPIPVQSPWRGTPEFAPDTSSPPSPPTMIGWPQSAQPTMPDPQLAGPVSEPLSTIEAAFRVPTFPGEPAKDLRQYGYSLFASPVSTFAPVDDVPVGPDYILGPGDDLVINVWGAMEGAVVRTVNRDGQIVLPNVGPLRVWGLTFLQADRTIREQLSRYYRGFQTSVTMNRLRTIRIYVVGEVCQPGSFTLSSLSTVTNALFSAGGPLKLGSLRDIQLKRNHHNVGTLDLYDFLLRGDKTRDLRLESGDTIFIPTIGPVAAIGGEVKRPAIYELQGTTHIMDLIEMAGGLTPQSYLKRVQIIRAKPNAEREVIDLDLTTVQGNGDSPGNVEVRNGDLVRIYPTDPRIYNTVSLSGVVKHAGEYEFKSGMRLSQLLPQGSVLPEAYLEGVEVVRTREDLTTEVLHLSLKKAWAGDQTQDIVLRPRDQVTVRTEIQGPKGVTLQGEVRLSGSFTIMPRERLSSVLRRAGGFTDKAFLKGAVFTRRSVQDIERKRMEEFVRQQEERFLAERTSVLAGLQSISTSGPPMLDYNLAQKREQIRLAASRVTLGRIVIQLDEVEKFAGTPNDILLENGDSLTIPQKPAAVLVMGSVKNPTAIIHREAEDIQYYINRAGGFSDAAERGEMYLLKADGSALTGFLRLRNVEPGDAIVVPPRSQERYDWSWMRELATIASQTFLTLAALAAIF